MRSAAFFCAVGAAALFAGFFPQLGHFLAQWSELLFVGCAQIGDALFTVGLFPADVGSGGIAFHGDRGKVRPEGTDLIPQSITIGTSLLELFPNTQKLGLSTLSPGGLRIGTADRTAGSLVCRSLRSRCGVISLECVVTFLVALPHLHLECGNLDTQLGKLRLRLNVLGVCLGSCCLQLDRQLCERLLTTIQVLLRLGEVLQELLGPAGCLNGCRVGF